MVGVPLGRVVGHEIHDHAQPAGMGRADQLPQILLRAEVVPQREMVRDGIAEVALLGAGDRREPQHGGTELLHGVEPRSDVIEPPRPEEEWRHAIDNRAVQPGRPFLGELGGAGSAILHDERGGAFVAAAEGVRNPEPDLVFAIGARRAQEQLAASDGPIAKR
jgi:hypothetical protein